MVRRSRLGARSSESRYKDNGSEYEEMVLLMI
jgi:hypothetical protein